MVIPAHISGYLISNYIERIKSTNSDAFEYKADTRRGVFSGRELNEITLNEKLLIPEHKSLKQQSM